MSMDGERKRRLRASLQARDGNICAFCGLEGDESNPHGPAYLSIDRVLPGAKGGKYVVGNCRLLCKSCNAARGDDDDERPVRFANKTVEKGYTIVPNVVLLDRELSLVARGLYAMLVHYARQDESCYPGQERLALDLDVSERKLRSATRELEEKRLIRSYRRGRGDTNIYVILDLPRTPARPWRKGSSDRQDVPVTIPDRQEMPPRPAPDAALDRHHVPPKEYADGRSTQKTETARERASSPVRYRGKAVAAETVDAAERLLASFGEATSRSLGARDAAGRPSPALKQIVGALLARPDVDAAQWEQAVRNTAANPPDWVDGQLQIGHVFGERAAEWALANDGEAGRRHLRAAPVSSTVAEGDRVIAEALAAQGVSA